MFRKARDNRYEERKQMRKATLLPSIQNMIMRGEKVDIDITQHKRVDVEALQELLEERLSNIKDPTIQQRGQWIAETYLKEYYQRCLRHRRWSIRMNALYQIEDFQLVALQDTVWKRYKQSSYSNLSELYQLIRTLSSLQSAEFHYELLHQEEPYPLFLYKDVLRRYEEEFTKDILYHFENLNPILQQAIVEWIGEQRYTEYVSYVTPLLSHEDSELRMSALKVFVSFQYVPDVQQIIDFQTSPYFQERMMVARIAKVTRRQRFKKVLIDLLSDPNWFVRQAAGEALSHYQDGDWLLEHVVETSKDRFAKEMALQWLGSEYVWTQ